MLNRSNKADTLEPADVAGLRTRRAVLLTAAGVALTSVGGLVGAALVNSSEQRRAGAEPPGRTTLTSPVEKRVLASTVVTRGLVGSARQVAATPTSAQGASVTIVTSVRTRVGSTVSLGDVVLSVSGRPLIALVGATPPYRDLRPDDDGDDVAQLQAALRKMGVYHGGDAQGHFGAATKTSVTLLYSRVGFGVPDTGGAGGKGDRSALRSAADTVTRAQQDVDSLRSMIAASGAGPAPAQPSLASRLAAAIRALAQAEQGQAELIASTGPMVPLSEV